MRPDYPEWTYPTAGVLLACIFLALASTVVVDGKDKPARPLDRVTPDRT